MLKNLLDACGASLGFYSIGYALAYGDNGSTAKSFIGTSNFFLTGLFDSDQGIAGAYSFWLFQFAFAATAATIVAGTLAERCQMIAYLCYSVTLTGFVYPVIVHAVWSRNGFLSAFAEDPLWGVGMIDFAGSGVVHVTGGATAIIATMILGPRKGRFYDEKTGKKLETAKEFPGHSMSLQMLGTFILWFGWHGFNAGSALRVTTTYHSNLAATAAVNTTLSAAAAGVTALFTNLVIVERLTGEATFNLLYAMNGSLAGLVSITAGCAIVEPWAAVVIGFISGLLYLGTSHLLVRFCLDDAVDAIPVHLANGLWGTLAVGLFASERGMTSFLNGDLPKHVGWFYSWGRGSSDCTLLAAQIVGLLFILGWILILMTPFFLILNYLGWFRADALEEIVGLDISYHGRPTSKNESFHGWLENTGNEDLRERDPFNNK
eukprot:CAMPEP_0184858264 /NCGR_PEP_ID=MMETSP0580-20130426/3395_1 /TAXON_ID=1118495 /ORGANISM="Dactyliosolen fragilissimus" /LENGTH=432 /DNA_ID=CAMNT_0027354339 /DNA_START=407 /DNA_END=1705 /DNA_ORIENTATION=+